MLLSDNKMTLITINQTNSVKNNFIDLLINYISIINMYFLLNYKIYLHQFSFTDPDNAAE